MTKREIFHFTWRRKNLINWKSLRWKINWRWVFFDFQLSDVCFIVFLFGFLFVANGGLILWHWHINNIILIIHLLLILILRSHIALVETIVNWAPGKRSSWWKDGNLKNRKYICDYFSRDFSLNFSDQQFPSTLMPSLHHAISHLDCFPIFNHFNFKIV